MGKIEDMVAGIREMMHNQERVRNLGIVAHIDHGKTTTTDSLLASAGVISEEIAGQKCEMDAYELEQQRGITIFAGAASMVHAYEGQKYLINLIDTPGHVDFGAEVVRSMRAVDGAIVLVCAVEGVMPQTETVLRQAIEERVRPVLFINKVDRLMRELKLTGDEMQARFMRIITEVNRLIYNMAPEEFRNKWMVNVQDGSVAFGSGYQKWALNVPVMKKTGLTFKDIADTIREDNKEKVKELSKKAPLHHVLLDMAIKHLPSPITAQVYRTKKIWQGDHATPVGQGMEKCDKKAPLAFMVTKVIVDPQAGEISFGRVFSGTLRDGMDVYLVGAKASHRCQQVSIYVSSKKYALGEVPAGNLVAVSGLKSAISGETVCISGEVITPFESIKLSEPVVTKAVEAKNVKDLPTLIDVLRDLEREDPSMKVQIDQETGEHKISAMGELHLEIIEHRIRVDRKVEIITSPPIVVYRETVTQKSPAMEGKSPNKHNKFYMTVEPLDDSVWQAISEGVIKSGEKIKGKELQQLLVKLGMEKDEAKNVVSINGQNIFFDMTRGISWLNETIELVEEAFDEAIEKGPLAREKCARLKVKLVDASLHEDAIHRGPGQVIPAVRQAIHEAIRQAGGTLLEPKQKVYIRVPQDYMGAVTHEIQGRRGQILDMKQEGDLIVLEAKAPVAEMFGFASAIRSAAEGRVLWSTENLGFEKLPNDLLQSKITEIRNRKGLTDAQ